MARRDCTYVHNNPITRFDPLGLMDNRTKKITEGLQSGHYSWSGDSKINLELGPPSGGIVAEGAPELIETGMRFMADIVLLGLPSILEGILDPNRPKLAVGEFPEHEMLLFAMTRGKGRIIPTPPPPPTPHPTAVRVWQLEERARGIEIEHRLATTEYVGWFRVGERYNKKFPLVDFQKGNNLASLKTVDTTGSDWLGRMQAHIDDLATRGATVNGAPANMILDIRVQPGGTGAAQRLIGYGQRQGVTVIVKEFP